MKTLCFQPTRWFFCLLSLPAQQALLDWLHSCWRPSPELGQEQHCREEPWPEPVVSVLHGALLLRQLLSGLERHAQGGSSHGASAAAPQAAQSLPQIPHLPPPQDPLHTSNHHAREETQWPSGQVCSRRKLQLLPSAGMGAEKCFPLPKSWG